ncbi:oxidoreductase [Nocardioides psychrotolerans]|uniref:DMSO/TMAO reductase YedYZ, molybdopterin-dependent catalytic subunit n=1 Tax=Nocardioides psychrotolerans TaxID=1005945 RepID=A0A1I3EC13_9ACTN|nr:molybdopterin-dependent oxidoreductase [Nocardioides psychrotolerans]GEP37431.1 oxidoreductase [Nocardioides psychrotolerans]SFH96520.1 DMSO/TMAO reductase YedYZ, molybdopterin-dependent catalytic subunit [Nocardioides psychrotolerans]
MQKRLLYASFGLLATLVGMATGHLVASLLNPAASPVLAVGSAVIDLTPTPMKEWAIRQFGTADKAILIGSVMLGVLVFAAIAGILARRRFALGAGLLVVLVAVAGTAAMSRPAAEIVDLVPSILTAVAGVAALWWLDRTAKAAVATSPAVGSAPDTTSKRLPHPMGERDTVSSEGPQHALSDKTDQKASSPTRRGVLIAMGVLAAAAAVMGSAGKLIGNLRSRPEDITLPAAADPAAALPKGLDGQVKDISSFVTSNSDFYRVDTRLDTPIISADDWTLTIDGDVDNEMTFTFDDLLGMDLIERDITMTCVSNSVGGPYVGSARWLGVRLQDLLDLAGVGSKSDQILSTDFEGMTISTPLDLATDGRDAMIAIGMNGEALPREHGFPARMIVPGLYGFISATKWVTKLTLTTYDDAQAYWTERDWDTDAPIKISARIDTPNALDSLKAGEVVIGGVAWAQQKGGVDKIEVRIDGGPWQPAELGPTGGDDYWRQWFYKWDAKAGSRTVAARVISGDGETQTATAANPFPGGSSGIQSFLVTVE